MTTHSLKAVFFDVDGVLLDSLPQHLKICRDKAIEYGLPLRIPSPDEFRDLVRRGAKVSPMVNFFLAVGFPPSYAARAVVDYERDFMSYYRPAAFPGVDEMLSGLRIDGLRLGLVTSNISENVVPALGRAMRHFERSCLFFYDRYKKPKTKAWCLARGAQLLNIDPDACAYVGDLPVDATAAREAGMRFLGVTYGWGIAEGEGAFATARNVTEIAYRLEALVGARATETVRNKRRLARA